MAEILKFRGDDENTPMLDKKFATQHEKIDSLNARRDVLTSMKIDIHTDHGEALAKMLDGIHASITEIMEVKSDIIASNDEYINENNIIELNVSNKRERVFRSAA
jgi:hypothetical protein